MKKLLLLALLFGSSLAHATTYYISAAGNDSWDGLSGTFVSGSNGPKLTIDAAEALLAAASPGDEILFRRGDTFTESSDATSFTISGVAGTAISPIIVGAYGTGARPILSHNTTGATNMWVLASTPSVVTGHITFQSQHWTTNIDPAVANPPRGMFAWDTTDGHPDNLIFDDMEITEFSLGLQTYGDDVTVQDSIFTNNENSPQVSSSGAMLSIGDNLTITGSTFTNNGKNGSGFDHNLYFSLANGLVFTGNTVTGGQNLKIRAGTTILVADNIFHDLVFSGIGIGPAVPEGEISDAVIERNLFYDVRDAIVLTQQAGSPVDGLDGVVIRNNIFRDRKAGAGGFGSFLHMSQLLENITVEFNTFQNVADEPAIGINANSGSNNIIVRNNIFSLTDTWPAVKSLSATADSNLFMNANLFDVSDDVFENSSNTGYATIAALQVAEPTWEVDGDEGDPLFTNAAGDDFTLQASSPAIDTISSSTVTDDFAGTARPQNTNYDMGAYEYASGVSSACYPLGIIGGTFYKLCN